MDIFLSESDKRIVQLTIWLLRKKLGESAHKDKIHDDMINCGNFGIRELTKLINESADHVDSVYQQAVVKDITELGLWVCYKDTAYRDVFFYMLDEILKNSDELRALIKPYVKPPEEWHVNVWTKSKQITKEGIEHGDIATGSVSMAESVHVSGIQKARLKQIARKEIKR